MLVSTLIAFLAVLQPISCWGSLGHRTVAYLAEKYLTADAHRFVNDLLKNDQGWDISDASLWADSIRRKRPFTSQWHFIGMLTSDTVTKVICAKEDSRRSRQST